MRLLFVTADESSPNESSPSRRIARIARNLGHEVEFFDGKEARLNTVPDVAEAWDAVLLADQSYEWGVMQRVACFSAGNFGRRLQFVWSGPCDRARLVSLNQHFRPHLVVLNQTDWPSGSFIDLAADRFERILAPFETVDSVRQILTAVQTDKGRHYIDAPELGLHGKWPIGWRLRGLEPLFEKAAGLTVLDLGAAEGIVARECLKNGAACVHGFDSEPSRVQAAVALCAAVGKAEFRVADLSNWESFRQTQQDLLEKEYGIVLYLGLHHHLPAESRSATLEGAIAATRCYFALRTSENLIESDQIHELLTQRGFHVLGAEPATAEAGAVAIYRRD